MAKSRGKVRGDCWGRAVEGRGVSFDEFHDGEFIVPANEQRAACQDRPSDRRNHSNDAMPSHHGRPETGTDPIRRDMAGRRVCNRR